MTMLESRAFAPVTETPVPAYPAIKLVIAAREDELVGCGPKWTQSEKTPMPSAFP
jgi:hypothetical protein